MPFRNEARCNAVFPIALRTISSNLLKIMKINGQVAIYGVKLLLDAMAYSLVVQQTSLQESHVWFDNVAEPD